MSDKGWNRSARPSELHSNCAENHFGNKTKFSEKQDFFLSFWDLEPKKFSHLTFFFLHFWQNCVLRLQSTNMKILPEVFSIFSQTSSFDNEIVILIANNFQRSCEKRTWPAQTTIIWKIEFPMKCLTAFFNQFRSLRKNVSDFWQRGFGTAVRTAFYLFGGSFWMKRHFSLKKMIVSISLDSERKIVWLLLTFFLHCWQNCIFCRQSTFLNTCSNNFNFSHHFQDFGSEFLHFQRKCFRAVIKSVIYVYRRPFDEILIPC